MAKVDPYLRPLFDALHDMLEPERVSQHLERGVIEVAPLAFMRGRTLNDSFIILDEAQNTSPEQMKMFLTRLGLQLQDGRHRRHHPDRPAARAGLRAGRRVARSSRSVEEIEFVRFGEEDVVRHKLVRRIVAAYNEHSQRLAPELRPAKRAVTPGRRDARRRGDRDRRRSPRTGRPRSSSRSCARWRSRRPGSSEGHVAIEFVDEERIRELNREYRQIDAPTDVLSFGVDEDGAAPGPASSATS